MFRISDFGFRISRGGVSLIEVLVYVAIFTVLSALAVNFLLLVSSSLAAIRTTRTLNHAATVAMERMIREIRQARDVIESQSTLGSSPGALALDAYVEPGSEATTTRKFLITGGTLALQEGSAAAVPLVSGVTVANLTFWSSIETNVYYVRISGSDFNDGKTPATAFRKISKAASAVTPGSTVYVGAGVYLGEWNINPATSGTAGAPITFIADSDGLKTGDAGTVAIDGGSTSNDIFRINGRSYITIDGFTIMQARNGVKVKSGSSNVIVRNMITHAHSGDGLTADDSSNVQFINNLSYANNGDGIELDGSTAVTIKGNTFYSNGDRGIRIEEGSSGAMLIHNIINGNDDGGIKLAADSAAGYSANYNLNTDGYQNSATPGPNDLQSDPLFVDPNGADNILGARNGYADDRFQLSQIASGQGSNSPAVDAGSQSASTAGMSGRSTRTDLVADAGTVDMGFHYRIPQPASPPGQAARQAVRVELTLSAGAGKYMKQQTFYGSAVLRGSY